jgi:hypothetical protein
MNEDQKPALSWIKSPTGVVDVYANTMHATWSLDDIRVRLGQIVDSPKNPNPGADFRGAVEERAAVTLSWRNAKILRDQLIVIIDAYEKVNGEIKVDIELPPSL